MLFSLDRQMRRGIALAGIVLGVAGCMRSQPGRPWETVAEVAPPDPTNTAPVDPQHAEKAPLVIARDPDSPSQAPTVTSTPFQSSGIVGSFAVSHGRLLANGRRTVYVELRVRPAESSELTRKNQIAMVLAIDTSGSMAGTKIADARRAAQRLVDEMRDDDMVGIVTFASEARMVLPLTSLFDARDRIRTTFAHVHARGNTDIANALRVAERGLEAWQEGGRVVIVTDGRDTSGAPRNRANEVAHWAVARGFSVSTLGIGNDYDDVYLADLASAGRGNYEFVRDTSALARFLSKELGETTRTALRFVDLTMRLPSRARITEVWGATRSGDSDRLIIGSLFVGDERRTLIGIELDAEDSGATIPLGGTLAWRSAAGPSGEVELAPLRLQVVATQERVNEAQDHSVLASAASLRASDREAQAASAFEKGDRARALTLNAQSQAELAGAAKSAPPAVASQLAAQKKAYQQHEGTFQSAAPAAPAAREIRAREQKQSDRAISY